MWQILRRGWQRTAEIVHNDTAFFLDISIGATDVHFWFRKASSSLVHVGTAANFISDDQHRLSISLAAGSPMKNNFKARQRKCIAKSCPETVQGNELKKKWKSFTDWLRFKNEGKRSQKSTRLGRTNATTTVSCVFFFFYSNNEEPSPNGYMRNHSV